MNNENNLSRRVFIARAAQAGVGLAALNVFNTTARPAHADDSVWKAMGEGMVGRPAAFKNLNNVIEVYMRREDPQGSLWTTRQKADNGEGGWEEWEQYDEAFIVRSPSAALAANGDIVLALVGKDGRAKLPLRSDNQWRKPFPKVYNSTSLTIEGEPTLARLGNGEVACILRTTGNTMWMCRLTKPETSYWTSWGSFAFPGTSNIAAAANEDGTTTSFARGKDGKLMQGTLKTNLAWTWKQGLSEEFNGDPVVARTADGILEVFVTRPDDKKLLRRRQTEKGQVFDGDGDWKTEEGLVIRGTPTVGFQKDKRIVIVVRADDGKIYQKLQESVDGDYKDWAKIESGDVSFNEDPIMAPNADGSLEIFARANDGKLYHTKQKEPNGEFASPA